MSRGAGGFVTLFKALFEFTVNAAMELMSPQPRRQAVPVLALADREWARAAARRCRLQER